MKLNVVQVKSEYKATWWWNALYNHVTEVAEWIDTKDYCELCESSIRARCNNGDCNE